MNPMLDKIQTRLYTLFAGEPYIDLNDGDSLAVKQSLRLKNGDVVACFNGDGNEYLYSIDQTSKTGFSLQFQKSFPNPADAIPAITVYIAFTKGKTKDRIVKELTPLGATKIVFYSAQRCVSHPDVKSIERLRKIAIESCRQCQRSTIPQVEILEKTLIQLFQDHNFLPASATLFWEEAGETPPLQISDPSQPISLIFGPEGGFTREEVDDAIKKGVTIRTLGKRILRSELAVLVGMILAQSQRNLFR
ncbi:MAG: 16S rRNA (uracil(1498)-N(3))-methyltransferase [Candidatus Omnitrophota bacterium]|jgi:16S rRNA (uracil1498-N3)-methyltransferase|nr:MAG: 16S rRNA (uracil(1498)-N(3))-methyltransferase [Candidatus Omnitrophota bacterium]